jgi:hypothetical protein
MPFDVDGTEVGTRTDGSDPADLLASGVSSWLTGLSKQNLNSVQRSETWGITGEAGYSYSRAFWFFFPELREVVDIGLFFSANTVNQNYDDYRIQGSADSTNGMDGTWENAVCSPPPPNNAADYWRSTIRTVSFSGPIKVLRIAFKAGAYGGGETAYITGVHVYGQKAAGEAPDDILMCDDAGDELVALKDWGDRPEGTTQIWYFRVKNASATKIANSVNFQLNDAHFLISWSADGPWTTVLDLATLGALTLSNRIYVKNELGPPLLTLGPRAARVIVSVGSWT